MRRALSVPTHDVEARGRAADPGVRSEPVVLRSRTEAASAALKRDRDEERAEEEETEDELRFSGSLNARAELASVEAMSSTEILDNRVGGALPDSKLDGPASGRPVIR